MYEKFFGLREPPFDLTPNPRYLYLTTRHREALSNLQYGITGRKGITVLVGEAGTGKTTLVRAAMDTLHAPVIECVYLHNPVLTREEFYEYLAPRFGLSAHAATSKAHFVGEMEDHLLARHLAGGTTALIVDEAQSLPHDLMEEVRLLANFETHDAKLLQVVLAGQPELADRLEHEQLRQLKQRVALRCDLVPLDLRETAAYISGRIAIAGGHAARIFTREAVQTIHKHSGGIPRTISVICDNSMVTAFAMGTAPIGAAIVLGVCEDFSLGRKVPSGEEGALAQSGGVRGVPAEPAETPGNGRAANRRLVIARRVPEQREPAPEFETDNGTPRQPWRGEGSPIGHSGAQRRPEAAGSSDPGGGGPLFGTYTKKKRFRFF